jgi:AraC-like DNA-binding protein
MSDEAKPANGSKTTRARWIRSQLIPYASAVLAEAGKPIQPILKRFGLTWPIAGAEIELPIDRHHELLDELAELSGDPIFALRLAQTRRVGTHGLLEYIWRSAPNIESALQELVKHGHLLDENSEFVWKRLPHSGLFGHRVRSHRFGLGRHSNEFFVATGLTEISKLTGSPVSARRVLFEHARGAPDVDYAAVLGAERVEWDAGMTGFELAEDVLVRPMMTADPALLDTLRRHVSGPLDRRALAVGESTAVATERVANIADALRDHLDGTMPSLVELAAKLGTSARSLQRLLAEEGTTLRALIERVRMEEAERRLVDGKEDQATISSALGFSSQSSFARAFRRWSGDSPQSFRQRHRKR